MTTKISGFSGLYWGGEERGKNEHQPIEQSLYSLLLLGAVADPTLPQGRGVPAASGAHTSGTGLLSTTSCQNH